MQQLDSNEQFDRARFSAFFDELKNHLLGKPTELLNFNDIKAKLKLTQESYRGLQDVPLDRIVGSVGRYHDFTSSFLPKNRSMAQRWANIYDKYHSLEGLPPIELYQVDDVYFVRDGNHRVSVARRLGFKTIQAYVTQLATPIDLEPGMSRRELKVAESYAHFLEVTELDQTRPQQTPITLTEAPRYGDLLEHIHITKHMLESKWSHEVSLRDAASYWYDHVYLPTIKLIGKYAIMHMFGGEKRTESDLYIWLVEYLWRLREAYGEGAGEYKISSALIEFLDKNKMPIPKGLPDETDKPLF